MNDQVDASVQIIYQCVFNISIKHFPAFRRGVSSPNQESDDFQILYVAQTPFVTKQNQYVIANN